MKNLLTILFFLIAIVGYSQVTNKTSEDKKIIQQTTLDTTKTGIVKSEIKKTEINSKFTDVGVTYFKNKYVMSSSRRTGSLTAGKDKITNEPFANFYCLEVDKNGNLSKPLFFSRFLQASGNQKGMSFSPDEKKLYYTQSEKDNPENFQLYVAKFDTVCKCKYIDGKPATFNSAEHSIQSQVISSDGKKMYLSSNMPGGFGGYDLYIADIDNDGMPTNPVNLGKEINTPGDEVYPYLSKNAKELYFSSNGLGGFGGQDVFVARYKKGKLLPPVNLGNKVNTPSDEIAFILGKKNRGFISTNRSDTSGEMDIYKIEIEKPKLKGNVREALTKTNLENAKVILIDEDGTVLDTQILTANAEYDFDVIQSENYKIKVVKEGYDDYVADVKTTNKPISRIDVDMNQDKAVLVVKDNITYISIEKIYFDFNKSTIKKISKLTLNKVVRLLKEHPKMEISINAHTDAKGSDKYNMSLSERRAKSTKEYLIANGIVAKRLKSKGYGETKTISGCKNNCTNEQAETDRRVEFIVTKQ